MAITHLKDGDGFFDKGFMNEQKAFGFSGSISNSDRPVAPTRGGKAAPPFTSDEPTGGPKHMAEPSVAGEMGDYAHGGHIHPHGHHVMRVEHRADGSVVHHHRHGGMTVHHHDGHITHHAGDGAHLAHGGGHHMARGGHHHPHGHEPSGPMERMAGGGMCQHHAHGGMTIHHADGHVTHHRHDGSMVHHGMAHGGGVEGMHDSEGEYVHRGHGAPSFGTEAHQSQGGADTPIHPDSPDTNMGHHDVGYAHGGSHMDAAQDKAMIRKAFSQHDAHMHDGEHEHLALARGGFMGRAARLPRSMKPMAERNRSPINTPPANRNKTPSPHNDMPGGAMGMGVEPSAEPDMAGSEQGIPQMSHGGRHRHRGQQTVQPDVVNTQAETLLEWANQWGREATVTAGSIDEQVCIQMRRCAALMRSAVGLGHLNGRIDEDLPLPRTATFLRDG